MGETIIEKIIRHNTGKAVKPGDIVIYSGFGVAGRIQTAKVEKVTPSGIVRTNRGSFKESPWSWSGRVGGYGKTPGEISPPTAELLIEAELQEAEDAAEKKRRDTIYKARNLISELYYNRFRHWPEQRKTPHRNQSIRSHRLLHT